MNLSRMVKKLCAPARFYLGISIFFILLMIIQNVLNNNSGELCIGAYKCDIPDIMVFFVFKVMYVLFWTWLLNCLCKYGFKSVSWFIVLLPFLLFAIAIGLLIYSQNEVGEMNRRGYYIESFAERIPSTQRDGGKVNDKKKINTDNNTIANLKKTIEKLRSNKNIFCKED